MNRCIALKIQLIRPSIITPLRTHIENKSAQFVAYKNKRGRFIAWIKDEAVTPELFKYKEDFRLLRNDSGLIPIPLYTLQGEKVTEDNYMRINWEGMTNTPPVVKERTSIEIGIEYPWFNK